MKQYIITYEREHFDADGYSRDVVEYMSLIDAPNIGTARKAATKVALAIATLTNCCSEDELNDMAPEALFSIGVYELNDYKVQLKANHADAVLEQSELDE